MTSYFDVFNLPVQFDIDTDKLSVHYRELQRTIHPDKYVNASDRDRRLAIEKATQINDAFETLKNPISRSQYLLQLMGFPVDETDTSMDAIFLMQQLELREQLAELKHQAAPLMAMASFLAQIEQALTDLTHQLSQQFSQQDWPSAKKTTRQMQFFKKLREEALRLEEELLF
ncbi:Fe-S protein assembly co-chaperone HscB [Thioflexithrix psekupsensis]|uniref:Co-chaperone protein HscB homolog n=1 Tax=Thioflexithrix psekupsensis TaxID=1570016 RepID=A0A251X7W5_9GAMM|nr:Fe-S protein assembly co-chaperone HscB [Thioflexithrix psekupsensis]OUD13299.1 Fe-S protein assembly co-chaperone HscB [Thioflexithrix psekupsensis]